MKPTIPQFSGGWISGTILLVEPSRELFFLRSKETRREHAIRWMPETEVVMDGEAKSSSALRGGQRVRLHCRFADHELKADHIAIERPEHPGKPSSKLGPPSGPRDLGFDPNGS